MNDRDYEELLRRFPNQPLAPQNPKWGRDPYEVIQAPPRLLMGKGPHEMRAMLRDGSIATVVGEKIRHCAMRGITANEIHYSTDYDSHFDQVIIRMVRELVAFEEPSRTTETTQDVAEVSVPLTWWDHFKYTYPHLASALLLTPARMRKITTSQKVMVTKHFSLARTA